MARRDTARQGAPLTSKQARFVDLYTSVGGTWMNATRSAEGAGYAGPHEVVGSRLLRNVKVKAAIEKAMRPQVEAKSVTLDSILGELELARKLAIEKGQMGAAVKATELKGKTQAMFSDRIEHVTTLEDVSDEELVSLIESIQAKLGPGDERIRRAIAPDAGEGGAVRPPNGAEEAH